VADAKDQDDQSFVLNFANDAVVTDAVSPEAAKFGPLQSLAEATRIFDFGDPLSHERR
jgi:hypothetical protein